jgi:hypothetical protein
MAERTSVTQKTQFGAESTAGTSVAASKFLPSLAFNTSIDGSLTDVTTGALKFTTGAVLGQEWTSTKVSGVPSYDELTYLLSSLIKKVTPTTVDTSARTWTIAPTSDAEDTIQTYTIEQGSAVRAHKSVYNFMTDMTLKGDRKSALDVSGTFLGKQFTDGITLTSSPTTVGSQVMMMPGEVSIYQDTTSAGLGTTKLSRVMSWELSMSSVRAPIWVVDAAESSWSVPVETAIDMTFKMTLEADATAMALLTSMRAGTKSFIRINATSPTSAGATTTKYAMLWDLCAVVSEAPKELKDVDGVYAIDWTFKAVHDSTWGKATTVALTNKVTAL